ncbi:response regulator transcription factor [Dyadobacter sp. CY312]|uniref:response regulator n=1 Tax=Dyadobacter sp. CY312 TaxID=2907303 RepID=UPI001F393554|nr:response regulator transcription factor [Dyadobacter sp. CY312]MCE7041914.1 response regulator transcription factor [Dyadobacter sp. CY312]
MALKILIIDDHHLISEGLKVLLNDNPDVTHVDTAENAFEAMAILKDNVADIVFLDINLPDVNGIDLCKKIKAQFPDIKVLALSTFSERAYVSRMIQNGASGYLIKSSSKDEIFEAIRQVQAGGFYMNVNFKVDPEPMVAAQSIPFLTSREKEVLELISDGLTNAQIAEKIFVSVNTINTHRQNLLIKFDVSNTAALIKIAVQQRLI